MVGLRTQEGEKFNAYWNIVQEYAKKQGSVFFLDYGDGRGFETLEMDVEDLSGWLIPEAKAKDFEPVYMSRAEHGKKEWYDFYCFAVWKLDGDNLTVSFEFY